MPTRRHALLAALAAPLARAADPALAPLDALMTGFVAEHAVPGAALAVARNGRLVYARGFGLADRDAKTPVAPDSLFRIASVSKPLTAAAVLKLVDRGKLGLDDPVLERMPALSRPKGTGFDARWKTVTVRQCLHHTGGWDRAASFDPIGRPRDVAAALGTAPPVPPADVVRYMLGRPLDFDPGARHAYSNLGYLVLGRVVEHVAGVGYERFVRDEVLKPLGVTRPRLGRATVADRFPGEVRYYDHAGRERPSLYPPGGTVPICDGGENFEGFEAHGGWVASAPDLVRFAVRFDGGLAAGTAAAVTARPPGETGPVFYGGGWLVRPQSRGANLWHTGFLAGSEALLVRRWDGFAWAVLFNTQGDGRSLAGMIDGRVHAAVDAVTAWPAGS